MTNFIPWVVAVAVTGISFLLIRQVIFSVHSLKSCGQGYRKMEVYPAHLTPLSQVCRTPNVDCESAKAPRPHENWARATRQNLKQSPVSKEVQLQGDPPKTGGFGSGLWVMLRYLLQLRVEITQVYDLRSDNYHPVSSNYCLIRPVLLSYWFGTRHPRISKHIFGYRKETGKKLSCLQKSAKWILRKILFWRK